MLEKTKHRGPTPKKDNAMPCDACGYEGYWGGVEDLMDDKPDRIFCLGFDTGPDSVELSTLCASCCRIVAPKVSRKWIDYSKRYWHLGHIRGAVFH
jgi:hypothetical protein